MKTVRTFYFSATGTTEKIVKTIAKKLGKRLENKNVEHYNFTLPKYREYYPEYEKDDLVVVGVPVYAGRVPNLLLKYLSGLKGNGAKAAAIVLYGNRNYDYALIELTDLLIEKDFQVIAAAAFIGEHSFSYTIAKGRPDYKDLKIAENFAENIASIIEKKEINHSIIKSNGYYGEYYKPKDKDGNSVDIRKVTPKTKDNCIDCKVCARICPMGSIPEYNTKILTGICIKCGACIKKCPVESKYFDNLDYLRHKNELEAELTKRREPELFV